MMLRAVESDSLGDKVFGQLLAEIVSGGYAVGSALPPERELTAIFGVNRHVVREALKRLEQIGLIRSSQGGRTRVLDFHHTAGLDLLGLIAQHTQALEGLLPLLRAGIEMRAGIGQDVARLCAERATPELRAQLTGTADCIARIRTGQEVAVLDQRFWQELMDGAGNLAYQLAFNSLVRSVNAIPDFSLGWLENELRQCDYRRPIAAAVAAGDPGAAGEAARRALQPSEEVAALLPAPPPTAHRTVPQPSAAAADGAAGRHRSTG